MAQWLALVGRSAVDTVTTVTLPVAVLLWLLAWLEASGRFQPTRFLARGGWRQLVYSAAIAAVPGCAGGIAVTRLYADGVVGSAALWAAHLATGGDASFVLLVGRPLDAIAIFTILFVLGSAAGILTSRGRGRGLADRIRPVAGGQSEGTAAVPTAGSEHEPAIPRQYTAWIGLVVAAVLAALIANRAGAVATAIAGVLAAAAVLLSVMIQRSGEQHQHESCEPGSPAASGRAAVFSAIATAVKDASEITLWVAVAGLAFYAVEHVWGPQVQGWLNGAVLPVTLIAAAAGMIPGCGPQIFLARLYTAGSLPFVPILVNSISQHGDSIFPLLSRRGHEALRVTVASALLAAAIGLIWLGIGHGLA